MLSRIEKYSTYPPYIQLLTQIKLCMTNFYNYRNVTYTDVESTTIPLGSVNNPASSCSDISLDSPSGEYWIQTNSSISPVQVYCNTNQRNCSCNTTGGWARVANLNMTDSTQQCPVGFKLITRTEPPLRTCGRPDGHRQGCVSTTFPVHGVQYSRVCGRIIAYQIGTPSGINDWLFSNNIETHYVAGISLTHGSPRQHIWTFINAQGEGFGGDQTCPCINESTSTASAIICGK